MKKEVDLLVGSGFGCERVSRYEERTKKSEKMKKKTQKGELGKRMSEV